MIMNQVTRENRLEELIQALNLKEDDWTNVGQGKLIRFGKCAFYMKDGKSKRIVYTRNPDETVEEFNRTILFKENLLEKEGWGCTSIRPLGFVSVEGILKEASRQQIGELEIDFQQVSKYPKIGDSIEIEARIINTSGGNKMIIYRMGGKNENISTEQTDV